MGPSNWWNYYIKIYLLSILRIKYIIFNNRVIVLVFWSTFRFYTKISNKPFWAV